jgi:hypothetical protein
MINAGYSSIVGQNEANDASPALAVPQKTPTAAAVHRNAHTLS